MANVTFPPGERANNSRDVVEFAAVEGDTKVSCAISLEALCDHFDADDKDMLDAFRANRKQIEAIALKLITRGHFEADGSILIRSDDC